MSMHVDDFFRNIERLPMMPKVVMEIIRCIDDENVGVDVLVRQVSSDVGLASSILKMANTNRFSTHGGITSVHDAVMLVGFKQIRNMACMAGLVGNTLQNQVAGFSYADFWKRSVAVAACANVLAKCVLNQQESSAKLKINPDIAFVCGILHDIGRLALVMAAPEQFQEVELYREVHGCYTYEAEMAVLGVDHAQLGAHLAQKWEFPKMICDAIEKHHLPDMLPSSYLADLIHVAEVVCCALEMDASAIKMPELSEHAMFRLNMSFLQVQPYFAQIECEYHELILLLD